MRSLRSNGHLQIWRQLPVRACEIRPRPGGQRRWRQRWRWRRRTERQSRSIQGCLWRRKRIWASLWRRFWRWRRRRWWWRWWRWRRRPATSVPQLQSNWDVSMGRHLQAYPRGRTFLRFELPFWCLVIFALWRSAGLESLWRSFFLSFRHRGSFLSVRRCCGFSLWRSALFPLRRPATAAAPERLQRRGPPVCQVLLRGLLLRQKKRASSFVEG